MSEDQYQVDFASVADFDAIADLLSELFAQEADFRPDRAKQLAGLRLIFDDPSRGRLFVLRDRGVVIGMANALMTISTAEGAPVLLLEDVIVRHDLRGRGLGARLVERVLEWAATQGATRATLLTDAGNRLALAFYSRMGFSRSGMTILRRALGDRPS